MVPCIRILRSTSASSFCCSLLDSRNCGEIPYNVSLSSYDCNTDLSRRNSRNLRDHRAVHTAHADHRSRWVGFWDRGRKPGAEAGVAATCRLVQGARRLHQPADEKNTE